MLISTVVSIAALIRAERLIRRWADVPATTPPRPDTLHFARHGPTGVSGRGQRVRTIPEGHVTEERLHARHTLLRASAGSLPGSGGGRRVDRRNGLGAGSAFRFIRASTRFSPLNSLQYGCMPTVTDLLSEAIDCGLLLGGPAGAGLAAARDLISVRVLRPGPAAVRLHRPGQGVHERGELRSGLVQTGLGGEQIAGEACLSRGGDSRRGRTRRRRRSRGGGLRRDRRERGRKDRDTALRRRRTAGRSPVAGSCRRVARLPRLCGRKYPAPAGEVRVPVPVRVRHPEAVGTGSVLELDRNDQPGCGLPYQVVEEDVPGLGCGVHLAAAPLGVRAPVQGADIAPPEFEHAESGDNSQVIRLRDHVGGKVVTARPVDVVAAGVVPAIGVPRRGDPVLRRPARPGAHAPWAVSTGGGQLHLNCLLDEAELRFVQRVQCRVQPDRRGTGKRSQGGERNFPGPFTPRRVRRAVRGCGE
ncbi:hypothetical protein GA0115259_100096 [Streptomyces sp. MnatMP-M17]|nr:hypothetical protein GA0115259_100096 [Streptomyces sp. MnatMP-M17]